MAEKDWTTLYPTALDTSTEQPDISNSADTMRASQINTLRDMSRALQARVGSNQREKDTLMGSLKHFSFDDEFVAAPTSPFVEFVNVGQTGSIAYSSALTFTIGTSGAGLSAGVRYDFDERMGGIEATAHFENNCGGAFGGAGQIVLSSVGAGSSKLFYVDCNKSAGAGTNQITAGDEVLSPITTLAHGQNHAWLKLRYNGSIASFWYSLNAEGSEPAAHDYVFLVSRQVQQAMVPTRIALQGNPFNSGCTGNIVIRHARVRFF